jgi:ATP-dependent helicase/nuclease subunit A
MRAGDQADRDRAIRSTRNLAVTAGAGTGKTTLLVEKILRKVLEEGVAIDRILALTFTEKAANEMRKRLRDRLRERDRVEGLDRAEIGTIHSFCSHILRQFPVEAGVAPDFTVDDGRVFERRFEEAWPLWLDRELGPGAKRPKQWREVLEEVDLETIRDLALGLASFSIPEEGGGGPALLRTTARDVARDHPEYSGALAGKAPPPKLPGKASAALKSVHKLAEDVGRLDADLLEKAAKLVSEFGREFREAYLRAGFVSFDAMLSLVHALFKEKRFPNVLELLRSHYDYILVDEFQDTDPVQGEIIQRLAEDRTGRLVPGRIFLVGDPKQSIYSFRGADIVAYQKLHRRILDEGGEEVILRTNFRSHGGLLEFVNAVFSSVIVENRLLQPRYEPIEPAQGRKPAYPGPTIEALLVEDAKAGDSREVEADAIATWILEHPDIPHKDTAILFRALSDVSIYIEALRARRIPYVIEGEKYFYGTTEVVDFVNLLRAVANPHDRIALAAVLRSPFGGLSDQELYDRRKTLDYRAASDLPIFGFLRRWHEQSGREGVTALIDSIFTECYALEIAQAGYHGEQAVANLLKLRQKAADLEAEGGCTLREFLEAATRAIRDLEEEGESPLADESLDAVRILSIHRAKGLEFPVVLLPDLHRLKKPPDDRVVRVDWLNRTLGLRLGQVCDEGGAALAYLDRERQREEWKRLLYVATTRAREILVLLGSTKSSGENYLLLLQPEIEKRAKTTVLANRRPPFRPAPASAKKERPDWKEFVSRWQAREKRAATAEGPTSPSRLEEKASFRHEAEAGEDEALRERSLRVGVDCHAILERMDFRSPRIPEGADPEVAEILGSFLRSGPFRALAEAEIVARELPFVVRREGRLVQGVIDLVTRRKGRLVASDYKSDRVMKPEEYRLIRDIYREAVEAILKEKADFSLIYLRHGKEVVI